MAKKQNKKVEVEEPQVETVAVKEPVVVEKPKPKVKVKKHPEDNWEFKNRVYHLKGRHRPLSYAIKSAAIYYFDEDKGYERELMYCSNQRTPFVDEMVGDKRLAHIIFRNGILTVPKEKVVLQKLLSLYHPLRDKLFQEEKPVAKAANDIDVLELEIAALNVAYKLDVDIAEAILRAEVGSKVSNLSSKELRRDLLMFAKKNPALFLELAQDENVHLRNVGIKATEMKILRLSSDQRTFYWGSNDRKLMTVPFDEHPYSALASWFKTDEGMEVYSNIEKRLNS